MEDLPFSTSPINARPKSLLESGLGDSLRASAAGNSFTKMAPGSMQTSGINGVTCGSTFDSDAYVAKVNHMNYLHATAPYSPPVRTTESRIGQPETYGLARDFFKRSMPRSYSASAGHLSRKYAGLEPGSLTGRDFFITSKEMAEQSKKSDPTKLPGGENFKYGWKIGSPAGCGRGIDISAYMTSPSALLRSESYFDAHRRLCREPEPETSRLCKCADWERPVCKTCGKAHANGAVGGCEYAKAVSDSYLAKEKDSAYAFTVNNVAATQGHLLAAGARLRGAQNCKNNCPVCRMEHYQPSELCKEHMAHTADRIRDYEVRSLMRSQDLGCGLHPDRLPCKVCHAHHIMFTPHDNPRSHQLPGSCRVCGSYHSPEYMLDRACRTAGMDSVSRLQTLASSTGVPRMDGSTYSMPHGPLSGSRGGMMNKSGAFNSNMSLSLGVSTAPGTRRFSIV
ncbi:hypothetical protein GL50803_004852 [Giardia duodenalis]|uniref:Uncharacterized protein n=1 Tax=Giardia intestinalis (strain ATCC 50803 / WB clone C6) TaxID=184922 RepID=A8BTN1_GIAIC|nr:hypothetical protein GL50803_004852 [Giardia intestinalis]KAE8304449.1 hypothetical protein GL50803_004852 [Giardia intestinalis]|eukprot:XP_001704911.1 Hypothetical protein GL50803_4852 [Giardia lamblia ATCC 50803]